MTTDDWCTPKWLCDLLGRFDLDPCSNDRSHVKSLFRLGPDFGLDGLTLDWQTATGRTDPLSVFCNPPYSNPLPWARKLAAHEGSWCALVKLDPSTRWWAELMTASPTVAPFRKRLRFEGEAGAPTMTANFPSVLVYSAWRPSRELAAHLWLPTYAIGAAS